MIWNYSYFNFHVKQWEVKKKWRWLMCGSIICILYEYMQFYSYQQHRCFCRDLRLHLDSIFWKAHFCFAIWTHKRRGAIKSSVWFPAAIHTLLHPTTVNKNTKQTCCTKAYRGDYILYPPMGTTVHSPPPADRPPPLNEKMG